LVKYHRMLKSEGFPSLYYNCEAAVLACRENLAWIKLNWGAAVGTSNLLNY